MVLTVFWKSMSALACNVNKLISLDLGAQLMSTSGKDLRPSSWFSSCDSRTYRGAFSGSSEEPGSEEHQYSRL